MGPMTRWVCVRLPPFEGFTAFDSIWDIQWYQLVVNTHTHIYIYMYINTYTHIHNRLKKILVVEYLKILTSLCCLVFHWFDACHPHSPHGLMVLSYLHVGPIGFPKNFHMRKLHSCWFNGQTSIWENGSTVKNLHFCWKPPHFCRKPPDLYWTSPPFPGDSSMAWLISRSSLRCRAISHCSAPRQQVMAAL